MKKSSSRKSSKSGRILFLILLVIAAGVFIFSGIKLLGIFSKYKKGSNTYNEIESIAKTDPVDPNAQQEIYFDVAALKEVNPDTKGYLYGEGVLSYPVVQGTDNSYYLSHLFDGTWNDCGCIFIDCHITEGFEARNCILYGHDMKDGSMFAQLHNYASEEYYQAHKEFHIFTEDHHYVYKVLSAYTTKVNGLVYDFSFSSDEEFVNFLYSVEGACPYETEHGELTADKKVITMSTCVGNDDDHRFVVILIRDREISSDQ